MGQELLQNDIRYSHDNKPQKQRIQRVDRWFRTEHNLWICSELKSVDSSMELGSLSGIQYYLSNTAKTIRTITSAQRLRQKKRLAAAVRSVRCVPKANCLRPICCSPWWLSISSATVNTPSFRSRSNTCGSILRNADSRHIIAKSIFIMYNEIK